MTMRFLRYLWTGLLLTGATVLAAEYRFPPPEFEAGHKMPEPTTPAARALAMQYVDVAVLFVALGVSLWLVHKKRSRRGVFWLSLFSLGYFGFYRKGCICAIGTIQNMAMGIWDNGYTVPLTVLAFFLAPIVVALFGGRAFCAAVCPHGALQDLVLVKPIKIPGWLEHALGVMPYIFLGAGVVFAATGSAFVICRYDPFIPLFRLTGSLPYLTLGAAFVLVGMFVGRPYCRFLCPYGAILKLAGLVSKWRVTVTPNICKQCRMCAESCPYGALREPGYVPVVPEPEEQARRRLILVAIAVPFLVAAGAFLGSRLGVPAARLHPTVALAEHFSQHHDTPQKFPPMTPEALSLERAETNPPALLAAARKLQERFTLAGWLFGGWVGLVIGIKLLALSVRSVGSDYEPDRGACVACARCFEDCPRHIRAAKGLPPAEECITPAAVPARPAARSGQP